MCNFPSVVVKQVLKDVAVVSWSLVEEVVTAIIASEVDDEAMSAVNWEVEIRSAIGQLKMAKHRKKTRSQQSEHC